MSVNSRTFTLPPRSPKKRSGYFRKFYTGRNSDAWIGRAVAMAGGRPFFPASASRARFDPSFSISSVAFTWEI